MRQLSLISDQARNKHHKLSALFTGHVLGGRQNIISSELLFLTHTHLLSSPSPETTPSGRAVVWLSCMFGSVRFPWPGSRECYHIQLSQNTTVSTTTPAQAHRFFKLTIKCYLDRVLTCILMTCTFTGVHFLYPFWTIQNETQWYRHGLLDDEFEIFWRQPCLTDGCDFHSMTKRQYWLQS